LNCASGSIHQRRFLESAFDIERKARAPLMLEGLVAKKFASCPERTLANLVPDGVRIAEADFTSSSRVEPSMSVKRKVTVPLGSCRMSASSGSQVEGTRWC
jgi:hypothetical protein